VPKTRKYPCCIEIVRQRRDSNLVLFIKGHYVRASQRQMALLACLHEDQGRVVPYKRLHLILGHKSTKKMQLHLLQQYMHWIKKTLTAHHALCMLGVVRDVGYVLCGHR
jgi:DNA-binding response OmpR family regulator